MGHEIKFCFFFVWALEKEIEFISHTQLGSIPSQAKLLFEKWLLFKEIWKVFCNLHFWLEVYDSLEQATTNHKKQALFTNQPGAFPHLECWSSDWLNT